MNAFMAPEAHAWFAGRVNRLLPKLGSEYPFEIFSRKTFIFSNYDILDSSSVLMDNVPTASGRSAKHFGVQLTELSDGLKFHDPFHAIFGKFQRRVNHVVLHGPTLTSVPYLSLV